MSEQRNRTDIAGEIAQSTADDPYLPHVAGAEACVDLARLLLHGPTVDHDPLVPWEEHVTAQLYRTIDWVAGMNLLKHLNGMSLIIEDDMTTMVDALEMFEDADAMTSAVEHGQHDRIAALTQKHIDLIGTAKTPELGALRLVRRARELRREALGIVRDREIAEVTNG